MSPLEFPVTGELLKNSFRPPEALFGTGGAQLEKKDAQKGLPADLSAEAPARVEALLKGAGLSASCYLGGIPRMGGPRIPPGPCMRSTICPRISSLY